jgi:hypothetical protein
MLLAVCHQLLTADAQVKMQASLTWALMHMERQKRQITIHQCTVCIYYQGQVHKGAVPLLRLTHQTYLKTRSSQNTCLLTATTELRTFSRLSMTNRYKHSDSVCSLTSLDTCLANTRLLWRSWLPWRRSPPYDRCWALVCFTRRGSLRLSHLVYTSCRRADSTSTILWTLCTHTN